MNLQEAAAASQWLAAVRTLIGMLPRKLATSDLSVLSERVTSLAWRTDCPNVGSVLKGVPASSYKRHLIAGGKRRPCLGIADRVAAESPDSVA